MKRLMRLVLCILGLTLVLTAPAAAAKPSEVSGTWTDGRPIVPPPYVLEDRGGNCLVTRRFWHEWGEGNFRGWDVTDFRIMAHGPCETSAPNVDHANLKGRGTFEGDLCLGEWNNGGCLGDMYSGSFDFVFTWHLTNPDPDPEVDTFTGTFVILQGYDGFEGLHGVLDMWGRTGPGPVVKYEGQVHFDPQPKR